MGSKKKLIFIILAGFIIIAGCLAVPHLIVPNGNQAKLKLIQTNGKPHDVSVIYINAGKADSMLIQVDGYSYLIDTGLKKSAKVIEEVLDKYHVKTLDGIFLTHPHGDHIGGLKKLAKKYQIAQLFSSEVSIRKEDGTNKIDEYAADIEVPLTNLSFADSVRLADDVYMQVLGPVQLNEGEDNDNSLVLRMYVNGRIFLFTGDMQFSEEETLLKKKIDVSADVYKIGNHGNPDATSEKFARQVSPLYAVFTTDTSKDKDSANKMVASYFKDATVLRTQDYVLGIQFIVNTKGEIYVSEA